MSLKDAAKTVSVGLEEIERDDHNILLQNGFLETFEKTKNH